MEIKTREIIVSIAIVLLMISLGLIVDNWMCEGLIEKKELYNKALKIDNDAEKFKYAIDTEIGNVLVNGNFKVEKGVSYEELKNDYMYVKKITEEYKRKTKTECDDEGNCETKVYYEWDYEYSQSENIDKIYFLDIEFNYSLFSGYRVETLDLENNVVDDLKEKVEGNYLYEEKPSFWGASVGDKRYYFQVIHKEFNGTIFAKATDKTIKNIDSNSKINISYSTLEETIENINTSNNIVRFIFWIFYLVIIGLIIYKYVELDNNYLDD